MTDMQKEFFKRLKTERGFKIAPMSFMPNDDRYRASLAYNDDQQNAQKTDELKEMYHLGVKVGGGYPFIPLEVRS